MEGGQQNSKVVIVIQARMQSSRLPGKVLMPIPFGMGKPVIKWIVDGLGSLKCPNEIIVATSENKENDILFDYCFQNSIKCFRGKEDDVLSRFIAITKTQKCNAVVRLTADNPIIDIDILNQALDFHFNNKNDHTRTKGLPLGMNFEIISPSALVSLETENTTDTDKEHVTPFIMNDTKYKKGVLEIKTNKIFENLRLTLDYASDYLVLSQILTLSQHTFLTGIALIKRSLLEFPWIFEANKNNFQKKQYKDIGEELTAAWTILEDCDLKKASGIISAYSGYKFSK